MKTPHNLTDPSKAIIASTDFETLSLDVDARVIGLGARIVGKRRSYSVSHFPIDSETDQYRRAVDPDTVNFWRTQSNNDLRLKFEYAMAGRGITLRGAIDDLLCTCENAIRYHGEGSSIFWLFKPASFDGAVLMSACRTLGPEFVKRLDAVSGGVFRRQALDLNSLKFIANMVGVIVPDFPKPGLLHDPAADALAQFQAFELVLKAMLDVIPALAQPLTGAPTAPTPQPT